MELFVQLGEHVRQKALHIEFLDKRVQGEPDGRLLAFGPFFRAFPLGDVHRGTDELNQFIRLIQDGVSHPMKMPDGPVRGDNSKFLLKISLISNGRFEGAPQADPIVWVNPFPKYIQRGIGVLRIKTENSEMFL